jgi:hypothetical protein
MRHDQNADMVVGIVENGVTVDCIPYEQGVIGKKYVFNSQVAFVEFMGMWYDTCVPKEPPVITGRKHESQ